MKEGHAFSNTDSREPLAMTNYQIKISQGLKWLANLQKYCLAV